MSQTMTQSTSQSTSQGISDATPAPTIITALDYPDADSALALARQLDPTLCNVKVGNQLFTAAGPALVEQLHQLGFNVFLDLKYHDIPNTVAGGVSSAAALGVWMVNLHASGGSRMMQAAFDAIPKGNPIRLIAVTVLTSMAQTDLDETGVVNSVDQQVLHLASMTRDCGLHGVVCSPQESAALRDACGPGFLLVTPGVRPVDAPSSDQRRVMTPPQAMQAGSDFLVIGRPVTASNDPLQALQGIADSLITNA